MKLVTILGPTASGKTKLAAHLALRINGEIISADSRQVYKNMNIGTGKDYDDYEVNQTIIPYHIIDIAEPYEEFSVFDFQKNFIKAFNDISCKKKLPVLCGGTGLYIEAILKKYQLIEVPENIELRKKLSLKTENEMIKILSELKTLHNTTDTINRERLTRAIEIEYFYKENHIKQAAMPKFESVVFGLKYDRNIIKERITYRLNFRLENGMVEEVESLIKSGISKERLKALGLEYKYITLFLEKEIVYDEMFNKLNIAIHQFSKRQMTWFRKMEKNGIKIIWIDGNLSVNEKVDFIINANQGLDFVYI